MPGWLDRRLIVMGLGSLGLAASAAAWPGHSDFIALANLLAWATVTHALYKSQLPPKG
jgi:hypothetical protein